MKDSLTAYEREIEQLNEVISHLQAPALSSEAQTEPHPSPIPRENIFTPVRFHPAEVREQTDGKKTINKTCMSLFSDSPSLLHTPGSVTKLFTPKQHPTTLPVEDTPQRANHIGAADVNDPLFHLSHAFSEHRHPVRGDHALVPAPEFLSDCEYLSNSSSASHSTAAESDGEPIALEDQAAKIQENVDSKTGIARNPLSLKIGRKLRYTEHRDKRQSPPSTYAPKVDDKDHSTASSSAPNLDTSPPLSESPQPDFPPSVGSHCSDLASPSLLRQHPSGSPWKHTQSSSPVSHHPGGNLSQSLFVSTPAVPPEDESCDVVTTPLCVTTELQIPNTDSQLSLDISDTMPPSPELCFAVQEIPLSRPVLKGTDCEVVSPQPASGEKETSVQCYQINSGFIERRNSTPREKEKRLIQSTLTNLKMDVDQTGRYESNAAVADSHIGRTLVLATPGMKPVDRMLGRGSAWIHKRTQLPAASSKAKRTLNDVASDDGENVLPQKKPHLQLEIESNDRTKYCEPFQVGWSLDATRLLPDRDEQTQSKEAQTVTSDEIRCVCAYMHVWCNSC